MKVGWGEDVDGVTFVGCDMKSVKYGNDIIELAKEK